MRLRVASDLHTEFQADRGATLATALSRDDFDVLVLAGDLSDAPGIHNALVLFAKAIGDRPLVYVTGNHEFYQGDRQSVTAAIARAARAHPNLHWLDHRMVEIDGKRFLGTPLWFARDPIAPKWAMNDFTAIRSFESWIYEENRKAVAFLHETMQPGDIVVTHHLPAPECIAPRFRKSALNPFFLCNQSMLIRAREPAIWIHGHTHSSLDFTLHGTRIICNPFGYAGYEANVEFEIKNVDV